MAEIQGSGPREAGAEMFIWDTGQSGTIGGGALEFDASKRALDGLNGSDWMKRYALGPTLGQCCGGNVAIVAETYDADRIKSLNGEFILRQVTGSSEMPAQFAEPEMSDKPDLAPTTCLSNGWLLEKVAAPQRRIWIYGAGHVGRALVRLIEPLDEFSVTWVDTTPDRFPDSGYLGPDRLVAANMAEAVRFSPPDAEHLIVTFSHEIDLDICHAVLSKQFRTAGLIGSETKWRRFQNRLAVLGHTDEQISRIECPIGNPKFGKKPHRIAVGVIARLLEPPVTPPCARSAGQRCPACAPPGWWSPR